MDVMVGKITVSLKGMHYSRKGVNTCIPEKS
jgi:hypothetical protein